MRRHILLLSLIILTACSNASDFETGEIKAIKNFRDTLLASKTPSRILDTRNVVTTKKLMAPNTRSFYRIGKWTRTLTLIQATAWERHGLGRMAQP